MRPRILAFGEILFDCYPPRSAKIGVKKIGGAPLNYCAHFTRLGGNAELLTAIGNDENGDIAFKEMSQLNVGSQFLSYNDQPTGTCVVSYTSNNEPCYDLKKDAAYFFIPPVDLCAVQKESFDALYFGSLALLTKQNLTQMQRLLSLPFPHVFCDINVRESAYRKDVVEFCLRHATLLKINRDEAKLLQEEFLDEPANDLHALCALLCEKYDVRLILVTLDKEGAIAYSHENKRIYHSPTPQSELVSAVGAGDSFFACFCHRFLCKAGIEKALEHATALSDFVITQEASVPDYPKSLLEKLAK